MSHFLWKWQAPFYKRLRSNPISGYFLRQEDASLKFLLSAIPAQQRALSLDIGVGSGHGLSLIAGKGYTEIAIDRCFPMLAQSRKAFPMAKFIQADALFLPFKETCFTAVLCIGLSEYVKDISLLLAELQRIIQKDGYLVFTISPPGLFTTLRILMGHKLYPRKAAEVEYFLANYHFHIQQKSKTPLQIQYLLRKN